MSTGAGASDLLHAEDAGFDERMQGETAVAARSPMQLFWRRFRRDKVAIVALIFIAMLILFLGTSLVVWVVFNLVSEGIDKFKLKEFDHQVGALFGLAKGVLLCVIVTLFVVTLASQEQRQGNVLGNS